MTAIFVYAAKFVRPKSAMKRRSAFVRARVILVDGRDKKRRSPSWRPCSSIFKSLLI